MIGCSQKFKVLFSLAVLPTVHGYYIWSHRMIGCSRATYCTWVFTMKPSNDRLFTKFSSFIFNCCILPTVHGDLLWNHRMTGCSQNFLVLFSNAVYYLLYMGIYYETIEWQVVRELLTVHGYLLWSHRMIGCSQNFQVLFSNAVYYLLYMGIYYETIEW